jgi:uncharacterized protein YdaU (DUF1376 family)
MANKPPAFQFYVKDWLSSESVVVMTAEQRGWYIQLLCHAWNSDPIATLPADDRKLKALAGAGDSWATDKQAVLDCFEVDGDRLVNRRLAEQFQQLEEFRNSKSEAGRKGNEARWNKDRKDIAQQSHSDDSAIANDRPSTATATASSTASSAQLSSAAREQQPMSQTGEDKDPNPRLPESLVRFWADKISNFWGKKGPESELTPARLPRATAQCDGYLAKCGEKKRKAILTAWEASQPQDGPLSYSYAEGDAPPTMSYLEPLDLKEVCRCSDPAPDTNGNSLLDYGSSCKVCGLFLDPPAGYYNPVPNPRHKSLRDTAAAAAAEMPRSKAFLIED